MLKLKKVAVTGSIASGKSTFCKFLKSFGATVVDADEIVHHLLNSPEPTLYQKILQLLGDVLENGKISRKKIAKKVFNNPQQLDALEQLLHPLVFKEIDRLFQQARQKQSALFVAEIPLLFETKTENNFDLVVTVVRDEKKCREESRMEDFEKRQKRMMPSSEKTLRSDVVIENNGSLEDLEIKAKNFMNSFLKHTTPKSR